MPDAQDLASLKIERGDENARGFPFVVVALVLLFAAGGAGIWWFVNAERPVEVRAVAAREVRLDQPATVLNASGYVTARRMATVSSKVTGRVTEVLIEEGMEVAAGELLATLDTSNTDANLRLAETELEAARTTLAETEVRINEARLELERVQPLFERGVLSKAERDRAQANFDSLNARRVQQDDQIDVAQSRLELWRQELADRQIRAPFAGVVVAKNAQPGEMISPVSAGGGFTRTGIGTIVDMNSLEIEVDVNESYINRVQAGQSVEATLDAYIDWKIPARVIAIIPTADRQRATVKVRIAFDQLDPRILPDMGVKVAFRESGVIETRSSADSLGVVIPPEALRQEDGRDIVFVVDDGRAARRAVDVGAQNENEATILSGLQAGERVIVDAPATLADGSAVREANQ